MADLDSIRHDRSALEVELAVAGAVFKGKACKCVFHQEEHASAGIYETKEGVWKYKCLSCGEGGDIFDVIAKRDGKTLAEVLKGYQDQPGTRRLNPVLPDKPLQHHTMAELIEKYGAQGEKVCVYTNPSTKKPDMVVIRIDGPDGKRFLQCCPNGDGLVMKAPPKPWPIYNRIRVSKAERVVLVEGEKCVFALHGVGIVATTSPGGCTNAKNADWSPLAGKTVVIWPDNDQPGLQYAADARKALEALPNKPTIRQIDPAATGLGPKGDAADFLDSLADLPKDLQTAAVEEMLADAESTGAGAEWATIWDDTLAGKRRSLSWGMCYLTQNTQALLPGTVTLLCGAGGASKSFLVIQWARYWHDQNIPVAVYELEGERAEHLQRAAAQMASEPRILESKWAEESPVFIQEIKNRYAEYMGRFGNCITAAPNEAPSLDDVADWIEKQAESGKEIIVVDPITAAAPTDKAWIADAAFVLRVKAVVRKTRARLILVIHPKKGHKGGGLDELAGGAVYGRLANTVLWLDRHEPPLDAEIRLACGRDRCQVNRTLTILKARHGRGTGHRIGLTFTMDSLTYLEHGMIVANHRNRGEEGKEE